MEGRIRARLLLALLLHLVLLELGQLLLELVVQGDGLDLLGFLVAPYHLLAVSAHLLGLLAQVTQPQLCLLQLGLRLLRPPQRRARATEQRTAETTLPQLDPQVPGQT